MIDVMITFAYLTHLSNCVMCVVTILSVRWLFEFSLFSMISWDLVSRLLKISCKKLWQYRLPQPVCLHTTSLSFHYIDWRYCSVHSRSFLELLNRTDSLLWVQISSHTHLSRIHHNAATGQNHTLDQSDGLRIPWPLCRLLQSRYCLLVPHALPRVTCRHACESNLNIPSQ